MSLILLIETSSPVCSVGLAEGPELAALAESDVDRSHAVVLPSLIDRVTAEAGTALSGLDAVAFSSGPGSYTGLRIGASTAKGLAYGLERPLLAVDTLRAMALHVAGRAGDPEGVYCPMIDARRMEVWTAAFDAEGRTLAGPGPVIVSKEDSWPPGAPNGRIYYFGSGAAKCRDLLDHKRAVFEIQARPSAEHMPALAHKSFISNDFEDIAYAEPRYLKAFWTPRPPARARTS